MKPVVVGVDGSSSALHAVRWAVDEAVRRATSLRLVHAHEIPAGYPPGFVDWHALHEALAAQARAWLAQAREEVEKAAPELTVEVVEMKAGAVPTLVRESSEAAVLVLGSRGHGGFTGLVIGSTAVEIAKRAHCPVVVARGTDHSGPVVVGVDGTPVGEAAIAFAFAAASARGVDLVAVHTWTDLVLETAFRRWGGGTGLRPAGAAGRGGARRATRRLAGEVSRCVRHSAREQGTREPRLAAARRGGGTPGGR